MSDTGLRCTTDGCGYIAEDIDHAIRHASVNEGHILTHENRDDGSTLTISIVDEDDEWDEDDDDDDDEEDL